MMPLSDQVLLKLRVAPKTARELSDLLEADITNVHHVLRGLQAQGLVEEREVPREALRWHLAPGVRVTYFPCRVEVTGARPAAPRPVAGDACRAITKRGRPCRMGAVAEGLCFLHAPRPPTDRDGDG